MNRRSFFSRLFGAAVVAPVIQPVLAKLAPSVLRATIVVPPVPPMEIPFWMQTTRWCVLTDEATEKFMEDIRRYNGKFLECRYTTDGSLPTMDSSLYGDPAPIPRRPQMTYLEWWKKYGA